MNFTMFCFQEVPHRPMQIHGKVFHYNTLSVSRSSGKKHRNRVPVASTGSPSSDLQTSQVSGNPTGNLVTMKRASQSSDLLNCPQQSQLPPSYFTPQLDSRRQDVVPNSFSNSRVPDPVPQMPPAQDEVFNSDKVQDYAYQQDEEEAPIYMNQAMIRDERMRRLTRKHSSRVMKGLDLEANWDNM